jgi:hypothetical protein
MKASAEQELFKVMSNRTRTRPHEIYARFSTQLSQLEDQISEFNKAEEELGNRLKKTISQPSNREFKLKSMTQPKFQDLLLNCELPLFEKNASKVSKLTRGYSTKSGKEFKGFTLTSSSIGSFVGFRSGPQSRFAQSKLISSSQEKIKNKSHLQSTMIHTQAHSGKG